ncbi:MFS transporter [Halioxenophilus sp. WMMB6]|uniref:spinster family MFS transporter n=1 Tax=Halioxenophilus sp. WMMB6 TaxID=3073815 RepID=UPI00295E8CC9|nr:MFS transporter [Halioxenophilus sp. WMMB6]
MNSKSTINSDQSNPKALHPLLENGSADTPYSRPKYRTYVLCMLTLVYAFNFIDRQLISILQESIKHDLSLSDTQLGLLTGFAFALFYVTAGIPIARWSDRSNRRNIIALAVGIWSFMTALSGFCFNYLQLLMARIGVGVGEAGGSPPAHSMISDIYPSDKRGTAMSIYSVGINIGVMLGFFLGGVLNQYIGWRWSFVLIGVPGVIMAIWLRTMVAEPIRGWSEQGTVNLEHVTFVDVVKKLAVNPTLRHLFLGSALFAMVGYSTFNWIAPFFIRSHEMGTASLGLWLALAIGLFGGIGTFFAGYLGDRLGKRNKSWYLWIPAISGLILIPLYLVIFLTSNLYLALVINFFPSMLLATYIGTSLAVLHGNVDPRMRATASALFYLVINIIGLGLGPTIIGVISDALTPAFGNESLRWAMLCVLPAAAIWSSVHYFIAAHHISKSAQTPEGAG